MANTGLRSFNSTTGDILLGSRAIDENDSTYANMLDFSGGDETAYTYDLAGSDIPISSLVTGVEVSIHGDYDGTFDSVTLHISISNDGQTGTYGTTIDMSLPNNSNTSTQVVGGSSNLWGLDFSDWVDVTNLSVKIISDGNNSGVYIVQLFEVKATVYYDILLPGKLKIKSGKVNLTNGKINIL